MHSTYVITLFDFNYWANRHILSVAGELADAEFTASSDIATRDLRGTLVHTLDVEWSWRLRLQGRPKEEWASQKELRATDYPDTTTLAEHWSRDEAEMRAWLATLNDEVLARNVELGPKERFPLWYYLVHIVMHGQQQRSDAAVLLTRLGHSPGNIDFLDFADSL